MDLRLGALKKVLFVVFLPIFGIISRDVNSQPEQPIPPAGVNFFYKYFKYVFLASSEGINYLLFLKKHLSFSLFYR